MKTGELAQILGVSVATVRNWIDHPELVRFFSAAAAGDQGAGQRELTESDVAALNTVRHLRATKVDWPQIADYLDSGRREREFPANAITADPRTIPIQQAEVSAKALATVAERDNALAAVRRLENQVRELEQKINDLERDHDSELDQLRKERDTMMTRHFSQLSDLLTEIGWLRGRLGLPLRGDEPSTPSD